MAKTTTDLYRRGNLTSPRMATVRIGKDIVTYKINGINWVSQRAGGVSTFATIGPGKNWWMLPAGFEYPDELVVVNDHGDHFNWEPSIDMTFADYVALLASTEAAFRKVN